MLPVQANEYAYAHTPPYTAYAPILPTIYEQLNMAILEALTQILIELVHQRQINEDNTAILTQQIDDLRRTIGSPGSISQSAPNMQQGMIQPLTATTLGQQPIGAIVQVRENGVPVNYIVIQQGSPSGLYVGFENGTVLLRQELAITMQFNPVASNDYANSAAHNWLNTTFMNMLDEPIRSEIRQIRIPYRPGSGISNAIQTGDNGLQTHVFLLSHTELGHTFAPNMGSRFEYFIAGTTQAAQTRRIGRDSTGTARNWIKRSPNFTNATNMSTTNTIGGSANANSVASFWMRPAFVVPNNLAISPTGEVISQTPVPTPTPTPIPTPEPSPTPVPTPPPGGSNDNDIDGEGLLGLITALIGINQESQNLAVQAADEMQSINKWNITMTSFIAAAILVLIFASGWKGQG